MVNYVRERLVEEDRVNTIKKTSKLDGIVVFRWINVD